MKNKQHLIELRASNFKRLVAVQIAAPDPEHPTGVMVLSGVNESGKSSVLDAITAALMGEKYVPEEPVHRGQEKGSVVLETEDLVITRTFTPKGGTLSVKDKEGRPYSTPQTLLNKMCEAGAFDPLSFANMASAEQTAKLLEICPVDIDLDENARAQKKVFDERRDHKKDVTRLESQLEKFPALEGDIPEEEVFVSDLATNLTTLQEAQRDRASALEVMSNQEKEIARLEEDLKEARTARDIEEAKVKALPDRTKEIDGAKEAVDSAEDQNNLFRNWKQRRDLQAEIHVVGEKAGKANGELERLRQERVDALKRAKFPVPGLSLSDEGTVLFEDLPFSQTCTSKQIRVGIALAAVANPTLCLAFVRNGSLLDANSMAALASLANEYDLQVMVERVDDQSPAAIEIVDGSTVKPKAAAAKK